MCDEIIIKRALMGNVSQQNEETFSAITRANVCLNVVF